ncbi:MAG: HAD family phosphatase [Solobacterium sp.]|jgi:Cof subfamily protein (haloacid dehalogenase superfamily)|nr:HAD family phosphatase [Solobacterium sp.]
MRNRIRAVFLDMDSTLYSHTIDGIPRSARLAVDRARKNNILVFACTGRHRLEMEQLNLEGIELDGYVSVNGALCYDRTGVFYRHPVLAEDMDILYRELKTNPFPCLFLEEDRMYMNYVDDHVRHVQAMIHTPVPPTEDIERIRENPVYMFIPYTGSAVWNPVQRRMPHTACTNWSDSAIDVYAYDCNKTRGMEAVMERFSLSREEIMAVGDGPNDVEMICFAGWGVCMGNGCDAAKKAADEVTAAIDDDGLYRLFIKHGLISEEEE